MTYAELYKALANLGFAESSELDELNEDSEGLVYDAINRAIDEINQSLVPIVGKYTISQDGTDEEYLYYDMTSLSKGTFLEFTDNPVMILEDDSDAYKKFSDYEIEGGDTLVIDGTINADIKVFYKKQHTKCTSSNYNTDFDIELPLKVHELVPLLAAYYVWLDDDLTKATLYYNQYETKRDQIYANDTRNKPKMRILEGGI